MLIRELICYICIFLFLLISPSSFFASYKDFFASYTIGELINIQNPQKIPHIKKLRDLYIEKKAIYVAKKPAFVAGDIEMDEFSDKYLVPKLSSKGDYKNQLEKYYTLKGALLNLMQSSSCSGRILANVIRSGVTNINRDYVYCKLDRCQSEKSISRNYKINNMEVQYVQVDDVVLFRKNVWVNTFYRHMDIEGDSNDTVNDKKRGVILGYDHSLYTGLYVKADKQNIDEKGGDSAKIKSMSLGMYGNIPVRANIKCLVEVGFGKYETKRNLSLIEKRILGKNVPDITEANFICTTINADIEISKNTPLKSLVLKPFAGLSISSNFYPSFKENPTTLLTMNVYSGVYWRSLARIGIDVQKDYKKWSISSKIFSEILLTPLSPEITYTYDFSTISKFKGTSEEIFKPGASLYLDYKVCERFSVSGNIGVCKGGDFYLNGGVVYSFGKIISTKAKKKVSKRIFVVTKEN
jgi:outer membrane autotransporter protein